MEWFEAFGAAGVFLFLFLLVLAVLWLIMPFAIFGTKMILRDIRHNILVLSSKIDGLNDTLIKLADVELKKQEEIKLLIESANQSVANVNDNRELLIRIEAEIRMNNDLLAQVHDIKLDRSGA